MVKPFSQEQRTIARPSGTSRKLPFDSALITADGRTLKTDAVTNEDLFWAIRGGGGNFGVATLFEYQLHPVGEVLAGSFELSHRCRIMVTKFRFSPFTQAV